MIVDWLDTLVGLGLFLDVNITFDGGFSVNSVDIVCAAVFVIALLNIWFVAKFLFKKVIR